ncbi:MAG: metallophosphoesterase family protein [Clostridia bacterium]|nr:metallophosphoesterase family protein [Clostridia bacterium]
MRKLGLVILLLMLLVCLAFSQKLQTTEYTISSEKLTQPVTLAVVSDLHNSSFGHEQAGLASAIRASNPDALLLTGDMAEDVQSLTATCDLIQALSTETPVFYVSGNHECASGELDEIKDRLRSMGVHVLEGESKILPCGLRIAGADDPLCLYRQEWRDQIASLRSEDGVFTVLLAHRPDRVEYYSEGFDLVLAGHAHGGQVRIPFLLEDGLWAPNQGLLPRYTSGIHETSGGRMIVSRGLSKGFPPRIFNRPELVIVHLVPEK